MIGLSVAAAVIGLVVVMAVVVVGFGGDDFRAVTDEERAANPTTAALSGDLGAVCKRSSVSNAADYRKPYTIVAFYQTQADGMVPLPFSGEQDFSSLDKDPAEVNVVACLYRRAGTEVKVGTCEFEHDDVVDHYATEYDIELREAKTGKSIENLGTVRGPAGECPSIVYLGTGERRIYGQPDAIAVKAKLAEFTER